MTSLKWTERVAHLPRIRTSVKRSWFRWGSEKERELDELRELYNTVAKTYIAWKEGEEDGYSPLAKIAERLPPGDLALDLLCQEDYLFAIDADIDKLDLREQVELRDKLRAQRRFLSDPDRVIEPLLFHITNIVEGLESELPPLGDSPFTVTYGDILGGAGCGGMSGTLCIWPPARFHLTALSRALARSDPRTLWRTDSPLSAIL